PESARVFSWIMNNYWNVNFPASQPGPMGVRYSLTDTTDGFKAADAVRFGLEVASPLVALPEAAVDFPGTASDVSVSVAPDHVLLTAIRPAPIGGPGVWLRLQEVDDKPIVAKLNLRKTPFRSAERLIILGRAGEKLPIVKGIAAVFLAPRESVWVALG
ncbi:MAG: hypothetical protein V2A58_07220, partial [Planctomycetota bacterium]